jgi:hypothetical protein
LAELDEDIVAKEQSLDEEIYALYELSDAEIALIPEDPL